jgi:basic membrane protein A and related proteins
MLSRRAALLGLAAIPLLGTVARPLCALVHTLAPGDGSVMDAMIANMKRVGTETGVVIRTIYAADASTIPPMLELLGEAGAAVVVGAFLDMGVPFREAAPRYPATRFVQLYADPNVPPVPNIRTVSYETQTATYLAGVFGALVSEHPMLGYVGGADLPMLAADANATLMGARSMRPNAVLKTGYVGSFQDPLKAFEVAAEFYSAGITFVQTESSASNQGVIQAAQRRRGRMVSAGSTAELAQDAVVGIALCDLGASLYAQTMAALRPHWMGGHHRTTLGDGVVDFVVSEPFAARAPAVLSARIKQARPVVERVKARIVAGTLVVPIRTDIG